SARIMRGHPGRRTETQPPGIWIDNVQSDPGVAADLASRLLSHGTKHHTYWSPADCKFERPLLGGQSPLALAQSFVHTLYRVNTVPCLHLLGIRPRRTASARRGHRCWP